jgi:tRNA(fMet)-specific endonuclease VapC
LTDEIFIGHRYLYFFLKDKYGIKGEILRVGIDNCHLSEITIAELKYGAEKSGNFNKHSTEVDMVEFFFSVIPKYVTLFKWINLRERFFR